MPEMPEVEIVVRGLNKTLINRTIIKAEPVEGKDKVITYPTKEKFIEEIAQRKIQGISRRGKYIIFHLDKDYILFVHLRMTGKLIRITQKDWDNPAWDKVKKYCCVRFYLDDQSVLIYSDVRRFGTLQLVNNDKKYVMKGYMNLGPEPLAEDFTVKYLQEQMKKTAMPIKNFLLDQRKIAGLGNIYVDEALALAKIHPLRPAKSIKPKEAKLLHYHINEVIKQGIEDGGTSFRDYRNADNKKGSHQDHLVVFQRNGQPCKCCGTLIEKIKVGGRGTHFCPHCQQMK